MKIRDFFIKLLKKRSYFKHYILQFFNWTPILCLYCPKRTEPLKLIKKTQNVKFLYNYPSFIRVFIAFFSILIWPVMTLIFTIKYTSMFGNRTKELTGKSIFLQVVEQIYSSLIHNCKPKDYYYFSFFYRHKIKNISYYILDGFSRQSLFKYINRANDLSILDNKRLFFEVCRENDLPTPQIIADFCNGTVDWITKERSLPDSDIILKECMGLMGRGLIRCEYIGSKSYKLTPSNQILSKQEVINLIKSMSHKRRYLVQPRLLNHPLIDDLSNGALITIRIVTGFSQNNSVKVLFAIFNMPVGKSIVNNLNDGAFSSIISLNTGILMKAFCGELDCKLHAFHPDTMSQINGRKIPHWNKCLFTVMRAHSVIGKIPIIGWDVCVTREGPLLIEGNHDISLNFHQLEPGLPLGLTDFPDILTKNILH